MRFLSQLQRSADRVVYLAGFAAVCATFLVTAQANGQYGQPVRPRQSAPVERRTAPMRPQGSPYQNQPGSAYQNQSGGANQNQPGGAYQNQPHGAYQNQPAGSYQNQPGASYQNQAGQRPNQGNPGRPNTQQHLAEWMDSHRNLPLAQQQSALENEPGFHQLKPQEQERMHQRLTQLNNMNPQQQQRVISRTEQMERLQPAQRQEVRGAMQQLGSLPEDRRRMVARTFHQLQGMPPQQRQSYMNTPQFRGQFNDQERGTLNHLMSVAPILPQAPPR